MDQSLLALVECVFLNGAPAYLGQLNAGRSMLYALAGISKDLLEELSEGINHRRDVRNRITHLLHRTDELLQLSASGWELHLSDSADA